MEYVPLRNLPKLMAANKRIGAIAKKQAYKKVVFTSLSQRTQFFEILSKLPSSNSGHFPAAKGGKSPRSISPTSMNPPSTCLPRRASVRINGPSESAKLVRALDFGLHPSVVKARESDLPGMKPVLSKKVEETAVFSPQTAFSNISFDLALPSPIVRSPTRLQLTSSPLQTPPLRKRVGNSILTVSTTSSPSTSPTITSPYGKWSHRFVAPLLSQVSQLFPHLCELYLCGCHINDQDFTTMLSLLPRLTRLDISYSTLKTSGVAAISRYCRHKLTWLDVSGIFKFGRNNSDTLLKIAFYCEALTVIVALECPEIYKEVVGDVVQINNRIDFQVTAVLEN